MKPISRILSANGTSSIPAKGRYIYLKAAAGAVLIKTDRDESGEMSAGDFVRMDRPFTEIYLEDLSGAQNEIDLVIADEGEAGKWSNLAIATPTTLTTTPDVVLTAVTKVLILAANANRREALIQVSTACRIGDTNTGVARGVEVAAGGSIILNTTAAIYGYSVPAGVATIAEIEA